MRVSLLFAAAVAAVLALVSCGPLAVVADYTPAALADQITSLPGLAAQPSFNMFSGYLEVDPKTQRSIFYWYVESQKAPATDPLLWWSNGGPGCSGLLGFLTEHGPFRPQPAPATGLEPFPQSWNTLANVLYVEAPAGVGFSYSNSQADYTTGDAKTAQDNFVAIQQFFLRFPHLTQNEFYISAESYGGHYVPMLAQVIVNAGSMPNFKGFLLGNPLTDMDENMNWGQAGTLCGHSLASKPTCDSFATNCLASTGPTGWCTLAQAAVVEEAGGLDAYGLDFPTCPGSAQQRTLLHHLYQDRKRTAGFSPLLKSQLDAIPTPYDPCEMSEETTYLNRADVRTALHVKAGLPAWVSCSNSVNYNQSDLYVHMEPIYTSLIAHGGLKLVVFSGDDDSVCATLGTQHWMYELLGKDVAAGWQTWQYNSEEYGSQIGGYVVGFKGVSLVTVHGAGHMVSGYQPERGLAVLANFLSGKFSAPESTDNLAPGIVIPPTAPRRHNVKLVETMGAHSRASARNQAPETAQGSSAPASNADSAASETGLTNGGVGASNSLPETRETRKARKAAERAARKAGLPVPHGPQTPEERAARQAAKVAERRTRLAESKDQRAARKAAKQAEREAERVARDAERAARRTQV